MVHPDRLIRKLLELEDDTNGLLKETHSKLQDLTGILNPGPDARIVAFANFLLILRSTKLFFVIRQKYLTDIDWWTKIYSTEIEVTPVSEDQASIFVGDFDQYILMALVQNLFSLIESRFRIFTNTIDPNACKKGTDNFNNIYSWLLPRLISDGSCIQFRNLLDFFRLIRNTIHNNGVYVDLNHPLITIEYNGIRYTFSHGGVPDYGDAFELLIYFVIPDLLLMMKKIILASALTSIPVVVDPLALGRKK